MGLKFKLKWLHCESDMPLFFLMEGPLKIRLPSLFTLNVKFLIQF